MKDNICKYCNAVNSHFSFQCSKKPRKETGKQVKPKEKIKPFSDKKLNEMAVYRKLRDQHFLLHPVCQFKGCSSTNIELHHRKSRKYFLCDYESFMSVCRKHHNWIHDNCSESYELGYLIKSI